MSLLTGHHCQYRGVGQGMKQTYLYMYFLFEVQWDRCYQYSNETWNYLVKGQRLHRGQAFIRFHEKSLHEFCVI